MSEKFWDTIIGTALVIGILTLLVLIIIQHTGDYCMSRGALRSHCWHINSSDFNNSQPVHKSCCYCGNWRCPYMNQESVQPEHGSKLREYRGEN